MDKDKVISLRMERQFIVNKADEQEYIALYRDLQPGLNVYWNGFIKSFDSAFFCRYNVNTKEVGGKYASFG